MISLSLAVFCRPNSLFAFSFYLALLVHSSQEVGYYGELKALQDCRQMLNVLVHESISKAQVT